VILSESCSISFLAFFIGSYIWYYNKRSIPSVIFLTIVALFFAFTRDTDAYRVLFMTMPVLLLVGLHVRNKSQGVTRHFVLLLIFIFIFIGSDLSSSNTHCRNLIEPYSSTQWHANPDDSLHFRVNDCLTPYTNARWHMPIVNNMFQRILPFEDRVKYFEAHGLPVTTELMSMKNKWANADNWRWYIDPRLAAQREWNYRYGRQTYMKYLITHPKYVVASAFDYRDLLLYLDGEHNIWHKNAKSINIRILSVFFLNDDVDLKMFLALLLSSLILLFIIYYKQGKDDGEHITMILLTCYIILITIPLGILIFHGDLMDLARHSFTNIVQLNLGVVLLYLFIADLLMMKMRMDNVKNES